MGPPSLRHFFFWDARSQKKKVSGRPMPMDANCWDVGNSLKKVSGRPMPMDANCWDVGNSPKKVSGRLMLTDADLRIAHGRICGPRVTSIEHDAT